VKELSERQDRKGAWVISFAFSTEKSESVFTPSSPFPYRAGNWVRVGTAKHVWIVWKDKHSNGVLRKLADNSTVPSKEHILLTEEDIPGAKLPRESIVECDSVLPNNPYMLCGLNSDPVSHSIYMEKANCIIVVGLKVINES